MSDFDSLLAEADEVIFSEFAITVPLVGSSETVQGIFDTPVEDASLARSLRGRNGIKLNLDYPVLSVSDSDASKLSENTLLDIKGQHYRVSSMRPDGTGMTVVDLGDPSTAAITQGEGGVWR